MITPRLLFEFYTFNYERTLFEKILTDKLDDAQRIVNFEKKTADMTHCDSFNDINLDIFIEILNILDEILLLDTSRHESRRKWDPDVPIQKKFVMRELLMWCCLFNRIGMTHTL